ncbi:MAG: ABC transporter permease [Clostridia bacterium]|nr:ABC transporter permease [Clostridia bacterium]MBQ7391013.1 ABC transporter permease [Clostridia bacterium]
MGFLNALPGAVAQGLIWGLFAIGLYISYKILDIADLTVDGSICTGACVLAVLLTKGVNIYLCLIAAFVAGAIAGAVTGLFHTAMGIPPILSGILTQLILWSLNLKILGKANLAISSRKYPVLLSSMDNWKAIVVSMIFCILVIVGLYLFFYTEVGFSIKSTGDNEHMSRAQGVNVNFNKVLGLAISNGIIALSGALLAQYQGFADINMGRGAIVIGLAAIIIGLSVSMKIMPNFVVSLIGVVSGGIAYYLVYTFVIFLGLDTDLLKMLSAIVVAIFLAVPYLKKKYFTKQRIFEDANAKTEEVDENA